MDYTRSAHQLVLLSARKISTEELKPFTFADLVERAWKDDPIKFGLKPREREYPCSNTVVVTLVGKRGLVAQGYLHKNSPRIFRLTPEGLSLANILLDGAKPTMNGAPTAITADPYQQYLRSPLLRKPLSMVTLQDCYTFWRVRASMTELEKTEAIATINRELRNAAERTDGSITADRCAAYRQLLNVSLHCVDRFALKLGIPASK